MFVRTTMQTAITIAEAKPDARFFCTPSDFTVFRAVDELENNSTYKVSDLTRYSATSQIIFVLQADHPCLEDHQAR